MGRKRRGLLFHLLRELQCSLCISNEDADCLEALGRGLRGHTGEGRTKLERKEGRLDGWDGLLTCLVSLRP